MTYYRDRATDYVDIRTEGTVWRVEYARHPAGLDIVRIEDGPARIYSDEFLAECRRLALAKLTQYGEVAA